MNTEPPKSSRSSLRRWSYESTGNHQVRASTRKRKGLRRNATPPVKKGRIPRVAKLMALAIKMDQLIADGTVSDFAELARLGHVSRARITQIMNLLQLAPDLQEAILFLPPVETGKDPITERELQEVVQVVSWEVQSRGMVSGST